MGFLLPKKVNLRASDDGMTLITALKCRDGIVIASDGQATGNSAGGPIKHEMQKIFRVGKNTVYGASGTIGMIQKSLEVVKSFSEKLDAGLTLELRRNLRNRLLELSREAQGVQKDYYGNAEGAPLVDILLCARDIEGNQRILHIGKDGHDEYLEHIGYACTGGGDVFGYAFLKGIGVLGYDLNQGKLVAYRIIKKAMEVGAYGLGGQIDIWSIEKGGSVSRAEVIEVEKIEKVHKKLEVEEAKLVREFAKQLQNKIV